MSKKTKLIIGLLLIGVIGLLLNEYLLDKKVELPLSEESVKWVAFYPSDYDIAQGAKLKTVGEEDKIFIIQSIEDMKPIPDNELQKEVAENQKPWEEKEICKFDVELQTNFWQRTPNVTLYLYEDGHIVLKCSEGYSPYSHIVDFDHEYSYLRYYKATSDQYHKLMTEICVKRNYYFEV